MLVKLLLFFLVVASPAVGRQQITQLQLNGAQQVSTGPNNYALAGPELLEQNNWKSISVNGDQITTWSSDCQTKDISRQDLSVWEKSLLDKSKANIDSISGQSSSGSWTRGDWRRPATSYSSSKFSFDGVSSSHSSYGSSNRMSSTSSDDKRITFDGNDNFSISKPELPGNLVRVFYTDTLTTFVYRDGTVQMKPTTCLDSTDRQLVEQLKLDVQEIRENMRKFQSNFNQNMQGMQQKLEQDMENMRHNLENMGQSMPQNFNNIHGPSGARFKQFPWQNAVQPVPQNGPYSNSIVPNGGSYSSHGRGRPFGNSFPFGPENSPFRPGFPFYR